MVHSRNGLQLTATCSEVEMKKEVFGTFSMYASYVLPLEVAQKIQLLLAEHGHQYTHIYTESGHVSVKRGIDAPEVRVLKGELIDASMLTADEFGAWEQNVKDSRAINKDCEVISPAQFKLIRGE